MARARHGLPQKPGVRRRAVRRFPPRPACPPTPLLRPAGLKHADCGHGRPVGRSTNTFNHARRRRMQVAVTRLGRVSGVAGLEDALRPMVLEGSLRTYIMDMGGPGLPRSRHLGVTVRARHAGARGVYVLECAGGGARPHEFYLDRSAGRFCLLHAPGGADVDEAVRLVAKTTRLRRACVGPVALGAIAGGFGSNGSNGRRARPLESVRAERTAEDGSAGAVVRWDGAVLSAGGTSARAHLRLAGEARDAYASMCSNIEECELGLPTVRRGMRQYVARVVDFALSRPIRSVTDLVGALFTGKPPLLMDGKCIRIEGEHYSVPVVDLENAESLDIGITPNDFHVGIGNENPGASVLRLLGHMQLHHDPGLTCPAAISGARRGQPHAPGQQGVWPVSIQKERMLVTNPVRSRLRSSFN